MIYTAHRFNCQFVTDAHVSTFKGSSLRGLFGHALKKVSCTLNRQDCKTCLLNNSCIYYKVFETSEVKIALEKKKKYNLLPHPFIIEPPDEKSHTYKAGTKFSLKIILLGEATDYLPYILYCISKMGEIGFGKKSQEGFGQFKLVDIYRNNQIIYQTETNILDKSLKADEISLYCSNNDQTNKILINFSTPLRLKDKNHFVKKLDFHILIKACLRRILMLEETFGDGTPQIDHLNLIKLSKKISVKQDNLKWKEIIRYSNKQKTKMNIGGLVGSIIFTGDLTPFMPLLKYCEIVHIGKQTAFGLGNFNLE